ncbi:MAG: hypothetical protein NWF04_03220 [Candidatus Bathyarchaeota archaeon]|nr:hypothetical protein [Candidatus Bathyarchaeota archaeon]
MSCCTEIMFLGAYFLLNFGVLAAFFAWLARVFWGNRFVLSVALLFADFLVQFVPGEGGS